MGQVEATPPQPQALLPRAWRGGEGACPSGVYRAALRPTKPPEGRPTLSAGNLAGGGMVDKARLRNKEAKLDTWLTTCGKGAIIGQIKHSL